tara:strand:+ start:397 stop:609 length:213 start_codon:yes stop_codon:yes gene_type:complete
MKKIILFFVFIMTFSSHTFAEDTFGGGEDLDGCSKDGCECINDLSRDEEGKSILSDDSSGTGTSGSSTLK